MMLNFSNHEERFTPEVEPVGLCSYLNMMHIESVKSALDTLSLSLGPYQGKLFLFKETNFLFSNGVPW